MLGVAFVRFSTDHGDFAGVFVVFQREEPRVKSNEIEGPFTDNISSALVTDIEAPIFLVLDFFEGTVPTHIPLRNLDAFLDVWALQLAEGHLLCHRNVGQFADICKSISALSVDLEVGGKVTWEIAAADRREN